MDCPIRAESGKGRSAHIFNLNERAVWHMLSKGEDFIDIYLKRLEEQRLMEEKIKSLESKMA